MLFWLLCSQVTGIQLLNESTVNIELQSTSIALFVWLDAVGFSGRFSDNGFLMVKPNVSVIFHSWTKIENLDRFESSLLLHTLTDVSS